jgi:predicted nucleotidyltransferase
MNFDLRDHTILVTLAGSRAYGTNKPDSDVDLKSVAVPPKAYFLGYLHSFEQADKPSHMESFRGLLRTVEREAAANTKLEGTVFDVRKFVALAADCNPNILDVLFCADDGVLFRTPSGDKLLDRRDLFLSAKAKHTFSGYAISQLKRIKHHRSWLLNPPKGEPTRAQFGLPEHTLIPADHLAAIKAAVQKQLDLWEPNLASLSLSDRVAVQSGLSEYLEQFCAALPEGLVRDEDRLAGARFLAAARHVGVSDNLVYVLQKEREYEAARKGFKQYKEWERNRNEDRAGLEAEYGYDTKHAMHLVRLLRMGHEILTTGKVHVWRGPGEGSPNDADELRAIRAGAWGYDRLVEYAEGLDAELTRLYKSKSYVVPHEPDRAALDALCREVVEQEIAR